MSLLGVLGGIAKVGIGVATGGVAGGAVALGSVLAGGSGGGPTATPLPPTTPTINDKNRAAAILAAGGGAIIKPSVNPTLLPTPDSVKVTQGGVTIGPGGSIFSQQGPTATAYFSPEPMTGVQSGASSTALTCTTGTGHRLNKTGYFLRDGRYVAPGTKCVKTRRRNSLNPRALSRAISRVAAAKKWSKMLEGVEVKRRRCR